MSAPTRRSSRPSPRTLRHAGGLLLLSTAFALRLDAQATAGRAIAIRGGTVIPVSGPPIPSGTVVFRDGKIIAVGSNVEIPAGAEVVEARGKYVMPGLIDAMTSLGIDAGDLNEANDFLTPQVRAIDSFNPFGPFATGKPAALRLGEALAGGVTTMYIAPGDAAVIGGQGAVVKTSGRTLASMVVREPAAIDMALGEQPKKAANARQRDPATRMAEVAMLRQMLIKAQEYERARGQNPATPRDLGMEALGRLLKREIPARLQANSTADIRTALRLAQEFNLDLVLDGAANADTYKDTLATRRIPVVLGQVSHQFVSNEEIPDRSEYPAADESRVAKLASAGVKVAIASFSRAFATLAPAGSSKWLLVDAAVARGYGVAEDVILRAVTLTPAEILGVSDRLGSLAPGKDADIVVLDGPPLSVKTWAERVYVNGELVHERKR